jgi:DNA-binding GntR family transcriptional regulator
MTRSEKGSVRVPEADIKDLKVQRNVSSLKQLAIEKLRSAILEMRFRPGMRLIERELCEMMGVSRTLVREALTQLEAEGLVRIIPHKGPIVAAYTRDEAIAIYELRAVLEENLGRLFTQRASDIEVAALKSQLDEIGRVFGRRDQSRWLAAKTEFYETLLVGCGNPFLAQMLRSIHGRVTMLRATTMAQFGRLAESLAELTEIVSAIETRDADAAAAACRRHVQSASLIAAGALTTDASDEHSSSVQGTTRHSRQRRGASIGR